MRIVQLLAGSGQGGADRVAIALGTGLQQRGHEVIYAVSPDFLQFRPSVAQSHECWVIPHFRGLRVGAFRDFARRARHVDLVLTHDSGARHLAIYSKLLGSRPPVWFVRHCISGTTRFGGVQLHRLVSQRQVAVSDIIARGLVESGYPESTVTRIYGGIDLDPFLHPDPAKVTRLRKELLADLPTGTTVVGMVGRLHLGKDWRADRPDFKGYDVLFRAMARVKFPWRVLALGPHRPVDKDAVRQIAAYHGADADRIVFPGFVDEPSPYYALMGVNVLPSRREGLGLTVIESMAAGIPTLGSWSGGIQEIIEHGKSGILFEEGNPEPLRAGLEKLVADPELRSSLAREGRRRALQAFDAPIMVEAYHQLLAREFPSKVPSLA